MFSLIVFSFLLKQLSTSSVYELNDRFFKETVVTCTDAWVVNFYLAWPDVCRNFFQVFEDAARQLNGRVKFGAFYQTKGSATLDKYGVRIIYLKKIFIPQTYDYSTTLAYYPCLTISKATVPFLLLEILLESSRNRNRNRTCI